MAPAVFTVVVDGVRSQAKTGTPLLLNQDVSVVGSLR